MENIRRLDKIRIRKGTENIGEDRQIMRKIKKRKMNRLLNVMRKESLMIAQLEAMVVGKCVRGRSRY